jgi:ribonuclease HI
VCKYNQSEKAFPILQGFLWYIKKMGYLIFSDASFNPKSKVGVGGYLIIPKDKLSAINYLSEELINIQVVRNTKNTRLEVETVIRALESFKKGNIDNSKISIYTDCQTVCDLLKRRKRLEEEHKHEPGIIRMLKF